MVSKHVKLRYYGVKTSKNQTCDLLNRYFGTSMSNLTDILDFTVKFDNLGTIMSKHIKFWYFSVDYPFNILSAFLFIKYQ